MEVNIKTIPHNKQRYPTVGDWWWTLRTLEIRVSDLNDPFKEFCIAIHEYVEAMLCKKRGVTQESIDRFDMSYEAKRKEDDFSEPGDSSGAPYKREHCFATGIERLLISELGIDWKAYEETINSL